MKAAPYVFLNILAFCSPASSDEPSPISDSGNQRRPLDVPDSETATRFPAWVTPYDIMTPEDEFYFHHLDQLTLGGDLAEWPLVKEMVDLGQNLVDAGVLANVANQSIYVTDQPRAAPIVKLVNECADILGIDPPPVFIQGDPYPNAYVAGLRAPHVLVLTSGLLRLYDGAPEELRFVIGHELGHIKAQHLKTHFLGQMLVTALVGTPGRDATFADTFVAAASVGILLHWFRESEYTSDRAGLICSGGDLRVCQRALVRLLHQTRQTNSLFDLDHPDFDVSRIMRSQERLRDRPFVEVLSYFQQLFSTHPFIPERLAALDVWAHSREYRTLINRQGTKPANRVLVITSVKVSNIPDTDTYVPLVDSGQTDPFVTLTVAGQKKQTAHVNDVTDAAWDGSEWRFPYVDGSGVILVLHDYNAVLSNRFVGSCRLAVNAAASEAAQSESDLRLDIYDSSTIVDRPRVTIEYRIEPATRAASARTNRATSN